ncbi:hypothetical protein, partial [Thiolapillus sp.]|uniref:hypothetical protein n=1 Tax=Thiolapillus sp. TaxID=2017437 RepID=UPI0025E92672
MITYGPTSMFMEQLSGLFNPRNECFFVYMTVFICTGNLFYLINSTLSYFPTPPPTGFCGSLSSPVSLLNKSGELFGCRFWL